MCLLKRAAAQGLTAQTIVRRGQLQSGLVVVAREIGATLIVLGHLLRQTAVFDEDAILAIAADLQSETGIEVHILESE